MEFDRRKASTLASMESPEPDKSPKGNIDAPIIPLLNAINSHPSYFTTSSCSGRISILSQPATAGAVKKKARGGTWVFITHEKSDPDSVLSLLFPHSSSPAQHGNLVFRFEPLIIAVECRDMTSAQSLVSLAISSGFRESGITSVNKRVIIAIRCSIRLEVPLGESERLMVSPEYVNYLVMIANEKMEANKRRTDSFFDTLLKNGFGGPEIAEGLQRSVVHRNTDYEAIEALNQLDLLDNVHEGKTNLGSSEVSDIVLSVERMMIIGEPVENLFLWGHSACTLDMKVLIFGGFGGMGRHARRNQCIQLEPSCGKLEVLNVMGSPSPRLGHTASIVGDRMFVIGGRADPVNILNDVWVLDTVKGEWKLLECQGTVFPPRHRHAAAVINSSIYVFGGLNGDSISSSLYVFDSSSLEWSEIPPRGEWPCPRHSHSLVAYGSKIFLFGGYDGEKALGDLYSFDVQNCQWKRVVWAGKAPYARFSHSMFVYKNYLGIIGGCPVRQHYEELSLFDLKLCSWKHMMLNSMDENLFVRCTASVVGDDLIVIGGGAACYAFGTKFSEPIKVNMQPLVSLSYKNDDNIENGHGELHIQEERTVQMSNDDSVLNVESVPTGTHPDQIAPSHWVLQVRRKYAKVVKDLLKKFGWLDLARKVLTKENRSHICFPVTHKFCTIYRDKQTDHPSGGALGEMEDLLQLKSIAEIELMKDFTCFTALNLLIAFGATIHADDVVKARKVSNPPQKVMVDSVADLIKRKGIETELLEQLPTRWERLGDMVVLPISSFKDPVWDSIGDDLWPIVAESLGTRRLARQGRVAATGTRDSTLEILVGDNGWVDHRENGILYSFDTTKCMFSWGNLSEKLRMGRFDCKDEVIVDLFAGIGYFVLPFLVRAKAKLVYACEWNPHAIEALRRNLDANSVAERCIILEGDNRVMAPKQVADRVSLGLLPTSEGSWVTAVRALRSEGGILHVHGNVKDSEEDSWAQHILKSFNEISRAEGHSWEISIENVERVKWYAPHIRHLVVDVRCRQIHR